MMKRWIYSKAESVYVTIEQPGVSVTKTGQDISVEQHSVSVWLSQKESLSLKEGKAEAQFRGQNGLTAKIYVPSALIDSYKAASVWTTINGYGYVEWLPIEGSEWGL